MPETQIDENEFVRRYRPFRDPDGFWHDYDWTDPVESRLINRAALEHRLWTTVDDGTGFVLLTSGWHFVNRLGYVITEVPFDADDHIDVFDPEDLEDWEERLEQEALEDGEAGEEFASGQSST